MSNETEKKQGGINKVLWGGIAAVIVVAVVGFFVWQGLNPSDKNNQNTSSDISSSSVSTSDVSSEVSEVSFQMKVTVEGKDVLFDKELKAEKGKSLMDIMKSDITEKGGIVESNGFISEICGVAQDATANKYWMYTVNGEFASVGAAEYYPAEGDKVVFDLQVVNY